MELTGTIIEKVKINRTGELFTVNEKNLHFHSDADSNSQVFWYVLYAANGKAVKIKPYLDAEAIEYFFPTYQKERRIRDSERCELVSLPLLTNLIFVKSSKDILNPVLKEVKLRLNISSDLFYRDFGDKRVIVIPENQMRNFIIVAGNNKEEVIYLSNKEVNLRKGIKVRITGGVFAGVEGAFMRIKGDKRLVVSISNLFSVATAYIPSCYVQKMEGQ
ncbi:MAG: UpxY family transcription antiterminator [Bacteroidales bacterium]|jgi:transcription antitermination factor NusG|nr:UpxY family transcription antiterminator [Bacteroidales bacterium]